MQFRNPSQIEELVNSHIREVEDEGNEISYDRALELTERNTLSNPNQSNIKRSLSTKYTHKIVTPDGVEHILDEREDSDFPSDFVDGFFEEAGELTNLEGLLERVNRFLKRKMDERDSC